MLAGRTHCIYKIACDVGLAYVAACSDSQRLMDDVGRAVLTQKSFSAICEFVRASPPVNA